MTLNRGFVRAGTFVRAGALAALGLAASALQAQPTHHVAWSSIDAGPWRFSAIYAEENNSPPAVVSFLALADPAALQGENIAAVWFVDEGNAWSIQAWQSNNPWDAIKTVKQFYAISDDEDERWGVPGDGEEIVLPEPPQGYAGGLLAHDPLAELVNSAPNREALVAFLVAAGYQAADLPVETDDGCMTDTKLNDMRIAAMIMLWQPSPMVLSLPGQHGECGLSTVRALIAQIAQPGGPAVTPPAPDEPPSPRECAQRPTFTACMGCCKSRSGGRTCLGICMPIMNPGDAFHPSPPGQPNSPPQGPICHQECMAGDASGIVACYNGQPIACVCNRGPIEGIPYDTPPGVSRCIAIHELINVEVFSCDGVPDGNPPILRPGIGNRESACNEQYAYQAEAACVAAIQCPGEGRARCICEAQKAALVSTLSCRAAYWELYCLLENGMFPLPEHTLAAHGRCDLSAIAIRLAAEAQCPN